MKKLIIYFIATGVVLVLTACSSTDNRIDENYDDLVEHKEQTATLYKVLEASSEKEPPYVQQLLDSYSCGDSMCVVGRTEIEADGASAFSCLEVSRLNGKAKLLESVKQNVSQQVVVGVRGTSITDQQLQTLRTNSFSIHNVSHLKVKSNYYKKIMRDFSGSPTPIYQCYTVVSIKKRILRDLILREASGVLRKNQLLELKKEMDQIFAKPDFFETKVNEKKLTQLKQNESL